MSDEIISSVDALITALGGAERTAKLFGQKRGTLDMWKHRGWLPSRFYLVHTELLESMNLTASPELWRFVLPKQAKKAKKAAVLQTNAASAARGSKKDVSCVTIDVSGVTKCV